MKTKLIIILCLIVAGVVMLTRMQGIVTPRVAQDTRQAANRKDPLTQDFESISKYKSSYMGDASNLTGLFYELPLSDVEMSFKLFPETFTAEISYKAKASDLGDYFLDRAIIYNSTAAFTLIDNLEAVIFNFAGLPFKILRTDVEKWYGVELKTLAEKETWERTVRSKLNEEDYVQSCINAIITQEAGARTARAIVDFYDNTGEPVMIYDEIPFEDGTLVLAERLTNGEHYPDLHFLDSRSRVTYLTRGSSGWTLNYTQFKGHYIYFGLAGVETRQYNENQLPVEKVDAVFSDKIVSMKPREELVERINVTDEDTRMFKNPQGYILPIEGRDIPEDLIFTFKGGDRKLISKLHVERSLDHMPDYMKSQTKSIYNSLAFTFTPMLTPVEWDKGYKEGEICLEGGTDKNGNRNVLNLRPAGHMSLLDSFILPQDIKPLYLSDNYSRLGRFSAGETVTVNYPGKRKLTDCRIRCCSALSFWDCSYPC